MFNPIREIDFFQNAVVMLGNRKINYRKIIKPHLTKNVFCDYRKWEILLA